MTALDRFPPLQGAIAQAEAWTNYLNARKEPERLPSAKDLVRMGIQIGETLPIIWRLTFKQLRLRPCESPWMTIQQSEDIRNAVRGLFFTVREALDSTRRAAEEMTDSIDRRPEDWDRLLAVIDEARQLEESVFRDWPSFADPLPPPNLADSLPVDESLAEVLGISVEEARQRMDARRREIESQRE